MKRSSGVLPIRIPSPIIHGCHACHDLDEIDDSAIGRTSSLIKQQCAASAQQSHEKICTMNDVGVVGSRLPAFCHMNRSYMFMEVQEVKEEA